MENVNDGFPKQIQNQQLHPQIQTHAMNRSMQTNINSSVSQTNMQYSPPPNQTSHAQHQSPLNSTSSKGIYTTSHYQQNFHNTDVRHHINAGQPQSQTQQEHQNYPYTSHPPLFPPPQQPSGLPTATSRPPTQSYPHVINSRVGPAEPNEQVLPAPTYYVPPAKKRRGRPPTHPIVDPGELLCPFLENRLHQIEAFISTWLVSDHILS